jgi:GTP-binding protein YchF
MQIGLVGLQFSGKTTLFNTLTGKEETGFVSADEAVLEIVKVPDARLDKLTELFNPKKKVNAAIEIYDTPGLRMSEDGKVKITAPFLNNIRNNDALFFVVRQFAEDSVSHPMGSVNPARDIEFLETEFIFNDLIFVEARIDKLRKDYQKKKDDSIKREIELMEKCYAHLENEDPLRTMGFNDDELKLLSGYQLLTQKELAIAVNFDENSIGNSDKIIENIKSKLSDKSVSLIPFSAQIEFELSELADDDKAEFMSDYGIKESALDKILRTSYQILGLQSFFTVGEDECRAWTIKKNYTAQQSAGVIHTDFFNRFIRAEVVHYDDFIEHGSFAKCKEAGAWRLEGKEYIVKDGDILNIRHN